MKTFSWVYFKKEKRELEIRVFSLWINLGLFCGDLLLSYDKDY